MTDPREISQRAKRLERNLPPFLQNFDTVWGRMRDEINESWDYFRGVDLSVLSLGHLREYLIQARRYQAVRRLGLTASGPPKRPYARAARFRPLRLKARL